MFTNSMFFDTSSSSMISATAASSSSTPPLPPLTLPHESTTTSATASPMSMMSAAPCQNNNGSSSSMYRYRDFAHVPPPPGGKASRTPAIIDECGGGDGGNNAAALQGSMIHQKLPVKMSHILSQPHHQHIVSWLPHGRSFKIHKPHEFESVIMPLYFEHSNYHSFNRLLNAWSFRRVSKGRDKGSYYHELFLRGRDYLYQHMRRLPKTSRKLPHDKSREPDFWTMTPVVDIDCSSSSGAVMVSTPSSPVVDCSSLSCSTAPLFSSTTLEGFQQQPQQQQLQDYQGCNSALDPFCPRPISLMGRSGIPSPSVSPNPLDLSPLDLLTRPTTTTSVGANNNNCGGGMSMAADDSMARSATQQMMPPLPPLASDHRPLPLPAIASPATTNSAPVETSSSIQTTERALREYRQMTELFAVRERVAMLQTALAAKKGGGGGGRGGSQPSSAADKCTPAPLSSSMGASSFSATTSSEGRNAMGLGISTPHLLAALR